MICKKCGQALGEETKVCPICRTVQREETAHCKVQPSENAVVSEEIEKTMEQAGMIKSAAESYPYPPRSRVLAGVLQIFFGGFGIGRFYLGYTGIALGQLFTMPLFFIGSIWGIIDGILILCGQVEYDANGIPLK